MMNITCCPYRLALLFTVVFLLLQLVIFPECKMNKKFTNNNNTNNVNNSNNVNNPKYNIPRLDVADRTFEKDEVDYYGTKMPIMGPLDGLPWEEIVRRVNYLKVKTQYPYRPMTYTDFKTSMDERLGGDLSGLLKYAKKDTPENRQELARWYPDSTLEQINAKDCTNYEAGHPFSCVQSHPDSNGQSLINGEMRKEEEFMSSGISNATHKILEKDTTHPTIFKNAPGNGPNDMEEPMNITGDLCRNCVVGQCSKGVCGSRLVELGNENILDVEGYVKSYLTDNIAPSANQSRNDKVNPWTFF